MNDDDDDGWVSFDVEWPAGYDIVQQYLGKSVMEHSNPPDWAFPPSDGVAIRTALLHIGVTFQRQTRNNAGHAPNAP